MPQNIPKLENWKCTFSSLSPYTPPETNLPCLVGIVYNHEKYKDGHEVRTSPIKDIDGSIIQTKNSTYILGTPDKDYVEWCKRNNRHIPTPEEPIKNVKHEQNISISDRGERIDRIAHKPNKKIR